MSARAIAVAWLLACACRPSIPANAIDLTIVSDGTVDDARLARVTQLAIAVSGVYTGSMPYGVPGLHKEERVQLLPSVSSGLLTIAVTASDANQLNLASGSTMVTLTGGIVPAMVTLSASAATPIVITPASAKVTRGKTQRFSANLPVTWSLTGDGAIDANGVYTAPDAPSGSATITATSTQDPTDTMTASVTVADYGLELYAGGLGGFGEADGVGGAALFSDPLPLASNGNGTLYVGDVFGCTLRKIDEATNTVSTLGGVPGACVHTDGKLDGMGGTARFTGIISLAVDGPNNVLWAGEVFGLRKIDLTTGDVTTVNATPGLFNVRGIALDTVGKALYVSERGASVIRKIDLAVTPPTVTTFAGIRANPGSADTSTGPATLATFFLPTGLASDGTSLFVADSGNNTVRKITLATGVVSTIAGVAGMAGDVDGTGSAARLYFPSGLALSFNKQTLYISEAQGRVVRALAVVNNGVTRVAGTPFPPPASGAPWIFPAEQDAQRGTDAVFGTLGGITLDPSMALLYVTDIDNAVIRSIQPSGQFTVSTVAGRESPYGYKDGPALSARAWQVGQITTDGNVYYFADNTNALVRKLDPGTGLVSTVAGVPGVWGGLDGPAQTATFERPEGIFVDGNQLFIADGSGSTIRQLDLSSGMVSTLAGQHGSQGSTDGAGAAARFGYPSYLTGDHNDHLFVTDGSFSGALRGITISTGDVKLVAGSVSANAVMDGKGTAALFNLAYGMAIENGLLYVCDGTAIRSVSLDGSFNVVTVAGGATPGLATGVGAAAAFTNIGACGGDGHGHIYGGDSGYIRRFDVGAATVTSVLGQAFNEIEKPGPLASASANVTTGFAFTPAGDVVYTDGGESAIMLLRTPP